MHSLCIILVESVWKRGSSKAGISIPASKRYCKNPAQHEYENSLALISQSASSLRKVAADCWAALQAAVGVAQSSRLPLCRLDAPCLWVNLRLWALIRSNWLACQALAAWLFFIALFAWWMVVLSLLWGPKGCFPPGLCMFLATALGIRAALILSPHEVGVVPSGSCVCCYIGRGDFISCSCLVWLCSWNYVCNQAGRNRCEKPASSRGGGEEAWNWGSQLMCAVWGLEPVAALVRCDEVV